MSNFNANPIMITGPMASGWRSLQTLNPGTQWGIRVTKVIWESPALAGDSFIIVDPKDTSGTVLLQWTTNANNLGKEFDFSIPATWRDFQVQVLTSGTLFVWYRT